ncbi:putative disease resistance protein RGA3 [Henckelia pumila]|uniref:putative disease resistance protein RGA3 n=1 Tax=Henckelia pumila TaxID=405737 RepID=UPI003C6E673C
MADARITMMLNRLAPMIEKKVVREETFLILNANDEAAKLSLKLKKIQQGLMDRKIKIWQENLQDIYYDIDKVLDQWEVDIQKRRRLDELDDHSVLHKVTNSFLQSLSLCFRKCIQRSSTIAKDIKKLNERLDLIILAQENDNQEFNFIPNLMSQDFKLVIQGRDDDLKSLMKKLLPAESTGSSDGIQIVSLIGMGGMGKTTLAQIAFNDNTLKDHFDVKIWISCATHRFDEIKIAKAILEAVDDGNCKSSDHQILQELLQSVEHSISGKRFLLVLDEVWGWTEDDTIWNPLKISLTTENGAARPGSRILVTTRSEKFAKTMGSTQIQSLNPLSDSYCWSIMRQIAFHQRNELGECYMLEEIGLKMGSKCKGSPLAAKCLGSLLRFKNSLQEWENVLNSEVWEMTHMRRDIFRILILSFREFNIEVKRCFAYCATIPKDSVIFVDDLIRIWMGQGFLYPTGTDWGDIEFKGREYFEVLAMLSFFQDFERGGDGDDRIISCKMHDLVHDYAQFLFQWNFF